MGSEKPVQVVGLYPGATVSGVTVCPSHKAHSEELVWLYSGSFPVQPELPFAQVSCFSECSHHGLDLFIHIIIPPTFQLDFGRLAQYSAACLCLCFHQLLGKGSMVTFKIVINLTTGQSQFRHPLHYCLGFYLGSSL